MAERHRDRQPFEARAPDFHYSEIPDDHIRIALRTGELIAVAAIKKGIQLPAQDEDKGDNWIRCTPGKLVEHLQGILDQHSLTVILKEAKRIAYASKVNGDNRAVAEEIYRLIRQVGQPRITPPEFPPIPNKSS